MLWILLALFMGLTILASVQRRSAPAIPAMLCLCTLVVFVLTLAMMNDCIEMELIYPKKREALEIHTEQVASQIRPVILRNSSPDMIELYGDDVSGLIILSQEDGLRNLGVVQRQVEILVDNQHKVSSLAIDEANLSLYRFMLFSFWR